MVSNTSPLKLETSEQWEHVLANIDTILFDCDGVLWVGSGDPVPNAQQTIDYIRSLGKKVCFVTNNSSKSREEYHQKFTLLNFKVKKEEIFTSGYVAAYYLNKCGYRGKVYLIGTTGTKSEFELLGMECVGGIGPAPVEGKLDDWLKETLDPDVGAVVVGYDNYFSYMKMIRAVSYLNKPNCIFIGTNEDSRLPTKGEIIIPGTGCFVSCIKFAAERDPIVVGKPCRPMFDCVMQCVGSIDPSRTLMVGDRLNTDVMFGNTNGMKTLAVLSGITTETNILNSVDNMRPNYYASSIAQLLLSAENNNM